MAENTLPFSMVTLLDSDEAVIEYLSQVLADDDTDELIRAMRHITRARGMTQIPTVSTVD